MGQGARLVLLTAGCADADAAVLVYVCLCVCACVCACVCVCVGMHAGVCMQCVAQTCMCTLLMFVYPLVDGVYGSGCVCGVQRPWGGSMPA